MYPNPIVADADSQFRQYLGLAIVIIAYVGGIIGWSWAAMTVEPDSGSADTTQVVQEEPHTPSSASSAQQ